MQGRAISTLFAGKIEKISAFAFHEPAHTTQTSNQLSQYLINNAK